VYLNDIFDKYLKITDMEYVSMYDNSIEDIKYLITKVKNLFLNEISNSDFARTSAKINYNGRIEEVSKVTLTINDKRYKEIMKGILAGLKNDKKSVDIIANLYGEQLMSISDITSQAKEDSYSAEVKLIIRAIEYTQLSGDTVTLGTQDLSSLSEYGVNSSNYASFEITSLDPVTISLKASTGGKYSGLEVSNATYESVNVVSKTTNTTPPKTKEEAVIRFFDDSIKEFNTTDEILDADIYFSAYVDGLFKEAIKYEIKSGSDIISCLTYKNDKNKLVNDITISSQDSEDVVIRLINESETSMSYVIYYGEAKLLDGAYTDTINEIEKDKKFEDNEQFTINMYNSEDSSKLFGIVMNADSDITVGATIDSPNVSNAVDVNELKEEEQITISNNLSQVIYGLMSKYLNLSY
jgi:hypothetical protein